MKKIIFGFGVILILSFLVRSELLSVVKAAPEYIKTDTKPLKDPRCLQIKVSFKADPEWKENGNKRYIMAGCDGQGEIVKKKNNPPGCTGGLVKIHPGETAVLGRCSCFFADKPEDGGCLKIGKELTIENRIKGPDKRREVKVVKRLTSTDQCSFKVTTAKGKVLNPDGLNKFICGTNEMKKDVRVKVDCKEKECPGPQQVTGVKVECPNCKETESEAQE